MSFWKDTEANKLLSDRIITVNPLGGGDFTTIKEALAFRATDVAVDTRYVIHVLPGSVLGIVEDNSTPLQVPGNTEIVGTGLLSTVIKAGTLTEHLFETTGGNVQFRNLILYGPTTSGKAAINFNGAGTNVLEYLYLSSDVANMGVGVLGSAGSIYVNNCLGPGGVDVMVKGAGANMFVFNCIASGCVNGFWNNGTGLFFATGCRVLSSSGAAFRNDGGGAYVSEANTSLGCHTSLEVNNASNLYMNGFFEVGSTTYSVRQVDAASYVIGSDVVLNTLLLGIANIGTFFLTSPTDDFVGGARPRRVAYAAAGGSSPTDDIVAITAGAPVAMTLPGPSAGLINANYPVKTSYRIENPLAAGSTIAPIAPDTLNGAGAAIAIPFPGSLAIYGIGGAWFTL